MAKVLIEDKKLSNLVRQKVIETIQEVLTDPDFGLKLQGWVKKRLNGKPRQLISLKKLKERY